MSSFLQNNQMQPPAGGRKDPTLILSDALRRNQVQPPLQCSSVEAKLSNLERLMDGAEREYRTMAAELDSLDREGRFWLVLDLVHKTALQSLDLAAAMVSIAGNKIPNKAVSEQADAIAKGTRLISDNIIARGNIQNGTATTADNARAAAGAVAGVAGLVGPKSAGGAYVQGSVDMALAGWDNANAISGAQGSDARRARTIESAVDTAAAKVQQLADIIDKGTEGGSPRAQRAGGLAQVARSMAAYNRDVEGAFDRRLEISSNLKASKANLKATHDRFMARYRMEAARLRQILLEERCTD